MFEIAFNTAAPTAQTATVQTFKQTHKKKNTYEVKLNGILMNWACFAGSETTPIAIAKKNGVKTPDAGWRECVNLPTSVVMYIVNNIKPLYNERAVTVIEYLDKETKKPIMWMLPDGTVYGVKNATLRLNHASRQDYARQLKKCEASNFVMNGIVR